MLEFSRLSRKDFPFRDLPNTPEQYYKQVRCDFWRKKTEEIFKSRETLIAALELDEDFAAFWERYREMNPDRDDYLSSLTDATKPFESLRIFIEYKEFQTKTEFYEMRTCEREEIQSKFYAVRPTLYHRFLEEEAARLNCDVSEVRPKVEVLPLAEVERDSELCSLPDDVVARIVGHLETIEIFRVSQVCRNWRHLVFNDASLLTRAEHSLTTHLLTFTEWMDPSIVVKSKDFMVHYQSFGWGLIKWCSNISQNLETLVLHELKRPSSEVMDLLRQCPNLRHLHLRFNDEDSDMKIDFQLPKLETLIIDDSDCMYTSKLVVNAFTTSNILRVFKGKLYLSAITSINKKRLHQNAFSNLIALQLIFPTHQALKKLSTLDQLKLRYLYLWDRFRLSRFRLHDNQRRIAEARNAFHCFLSKQNQLEVLVSLWELATDKNTIKLFIKKNQNLKRALLSFRVTSLANEEAFESTDQRDQSLDENVLVSFQEMLLEKEPSTDLSTFVFLARDESSKSFLEDAMTDFSIYQDGDEHFDMFEKWDLSHPTMRKRLGIDQ